jgi:hypothetical protein
VIIQKQYIRNLDLYLDASYQDKTLIFGHKIENLTDGSIKRLGFRETPSVDDGILPNAVGPFSRFNAEGKWILHRDQPMETAYREVIWHWKEWRGRDDTEEKSDIRDVEYKRYPRTFVPPPSIELKIGKTAAGQLAVLSPAITLTDENRAQVKHIINLVLEFFDYCEVFGESLDEMASAPLRRLNWRLLPPGEYPWPKLREQIQELLECTGKGKQEFSNTGSKPLMVMDLSFAQLVKVVFEVILFLDFPTRQRIFLRVCTPEMLRMSSHMTGPLYPS